MTEETQGKLREHERAAHEPHAQKALEAEPRSVLPSMGSVVQAGAFGAALGGVTTGVQEMARVKKGEITTDEAIENVVKSSAQGAMTMAVASVASQVVRSHPVFGFIALAAAGIGAFVLLSGKSETKTDAQTADATDSPEKAPRKQSKTASRRPASGKAS